MSLQSPFARKTVAAFSLGFFLVLPATLFAQTNYYATNGTEYAITGQLPGDNVRPDVAMNGGGGFVVWQDNATPSGAWGINATRLDPTLSATTWSDERVNNSQDTNDEENARVALLKGGGAVIVWQGGVEGYQHIYARFLSLSNTFLTTTDILVSTYTNPASFQANPAVTVLNNGNVAVVWGSYDQASSTSMQDVYGQVLSPSGQAIGTNFLINQFIPYNQRTPGIAALAGGGFVVAWVSEQERAVGAANSSAVLAGQEVYPSIDIYARLYTSNAVAVSNEFLVNADSNPCADPAVAAGSDGGFMIAWCAHDMVDLTNGWDIYACPFSSAGAAGPVLPVNSYTYGDQYVPRISSIGTDYLVVWTSMGQDGSREGVFGQFLHNSGTNSAPVGGEFLVNTTTLGQQMQQAVASDGASQFLAVWTSSEGYTSTNYNFNLYGQRYVNVQDVLLTMGAPNVWAPFTLSNNVYQPQLVVSWPLLQGISVSNYQVSVDGAASPTGIVPASSDSWTMTAANGLSTNSAHSFSVNYMTTAGGSSPISPSTSGTTWSGLNWGGIPYEWMAEYFGGYDPATGKYTTTFWPSATRLLAPNLTLLEIFETGGNPLDPATWLTSSLVQTRQGMELNWNTQPGLTYQVQESTNMFSWSDIGTPRYAAGTNDFIYVGGQASSFYRVQCVNP